MMGILNNERIVRNGYEEGNESQGEAECPVVQCADCDSAAADCGGTDGCAAEERTRECRRQCAFAALTATDAPTEAPTELATSTPEAAATPEITAAPEATAAPEVTDVPEATATPDLSQVKAFLVVTVGDKTYQPIPLTEEGYYRFRHGDCINIVHVTPTSIDMHEANCDNQDCVEQGEVTLENKDTRILGNRIICLPNQVTLQLYSRDELMDWLTTVQEDAANE